MHRHSPYCRRRSGDISCRFGYDLNKVIRATFIDEVTNRVVNGRRMEEDLKAVPYNPALTKMFWAQINVERTQGGGALEYLMKYSFKPPAPKEVRIQTRDDTRTEHPSSSIIVQNDIRAYMQARAVGPVDGC